MLSIIYVSLSELHFLLNFMEIAPLPWLEGPQELSKEETLECVSSLVKKQYLLKNAHSEYYLDTGLNFMLSVVGKSSNVFVLDGSETMREAIFFHGDTIVQIQQRGNIAEIMWLPALPLLIGQIANSLAPFLNKTTHEPKRCSANKRDFLLKQYQEQGYSLQWIFSAHEGCGGSIPKYIVLSNGKEQIMLYACDNEMVLWKPNKADLINTLTKALAKMHGHAIQEGGVLDV